LSAKRKTPERGADKKLGPPKKKKKKASRHVPNFTIKLRADGTYKIIRSGKKPPSPKPDEAHIEVSPGATWRVQSGSDWPPAVLTEPGSDWPPG
jgi:hypothetical protein